MSVDLGNWLWLGLRFGDTDFRWEVEDISLATEGSTGQNHKRSRGLNSVKRREMKCVVL
jgi:hypothetical protein